MRSIGILKGAGGGADHVALDGGGARQQTPGAAAPAACCGARRAINSGDTAWMLTSTALVLMMTVPGLALFYGGMVRKMNVLATVMQSFAVTCLVTVLWMVIGYSFAFTDGIAVSSAGPAGFCCTG